MKTPPLLRLGIVSIFLTAIASAQFIRVTPSSASFGAGGGTQSVSISALSGGLEPVNDTWSLNSTLPAWLSLAPTSGRAPDSATITAQPKPDPGTRSFTIRFRSGSGLIDTVAVTQTGACQPQTISWSFPATAGACETVPLSATSTSGRPVTFLRVSGPGSINGSTLSFSGTGTVRVRASVTGDAAYCAATLERNIVVSKCAQTITFNLPGELQASQIPYPLTATASSGLPVSFAVTSGPGVISLGQLNFTGFGDVQVRATQGGNALYNAAPAVTRTVRPVQLNQTVTFDPPATLVFANQMITLQASSTSGEPISYSVAGPGSVSGNVLTVTGPGLLTVTATAEETTFFTEANLSTTIRSFGPEELPELQRLGFVSNAAARAGLAEAFFARTLAEFRHLYPLAAGEAPPVWPESDLQQAWNDSLPSPAVRIAVSEADFMAWMTEQVSARIRALADTQPAGPARRLYQVLNAAVLHVGDSYAALAAEAFEAQLEIGTLLGQRTEVRFASFTPTFSNSAPDIERDWVAQCFGRLYDLALPDSTLRADLAATSLFDPGVALDASFQAIVDGLFDLIEPAPTPELRAFLNNLYGLRNPPGVGGAPTKANGDGFSQSDWEMALDDLLNQMIEITDEVDQIREQVVPPTPTEVQQFAAGANKTIKGLGGALAALSWGLDSFGLVSSEDLRKIEEVGKLTLNAASTLIKAVEIISKFDTESLFSFANAAIAGNVIGAVAGLLGEFLGSQSTEEKILEGIQIIQMQIASLAQYVEARFDGIELQLDAVLETLGAIQDGLANLQGDLQSVSTALAAARLQLARFEAQTYSAFEVLTRQGLSDAVADALDRTPGSLTREEFREAEEAFYTHAVVNAKNTVLLPPSLCSGGTCGDPLLLRDGGPFIYLRTLNAVPTQLLGLPPLTNESLLGNPVEWLWAAGAYLTLAAQQPQHLDELETARLTNLIGVGESTRAALARTTYWPDGPNQRAEEVFEALIANVETKTATVRQDLRDIHEAAENNFVRQLLVQHQPWPDSTGFSVANYYPFVSDWAAANFYTNYLGQELPTRISPQVQALALAKYLESEGAFTLFPGDPFGGATISGFNGQQVEDIFCPTNPSVFRRALTRTWSFRGSGDELLFRQRFVSDLVYCQGDGVTTEEAFRTLGQQGFFLSHLSEERPGAGGETWDEAIANALESSFLGQAQAFKDAVTASVRSDLTPGGPALGLALDDLENALTLLLTYTSAAFPGSLQTNEALILLNAGGLLDLARDPRSAVLDLYPVTPTDQVEAPYEGFTLGEDPQVLRDTFSGLLAEVAQSGITEADLVFTPVLDRLRRLRDRNNPGARFDQEIVLQSLVPPLLSLNTPVALIASSTSGLPVGISVSPAAGSYDPVNRELTLLQPAGELVVELTVPSTPYYNAVSKSVVYESFSGIGLTSDTIREELPPGTAVGSFLDLNAPPAGPFAYSLVSGFGDADNSLFAIVGDQLVSNAVFDFETDPGPFSIRVQADDGSGGTVSDSFQIQVGEGDSFSDAMESFGLSGEDALPDADANHDGYSNFFAWALGVAPVNIAGVNPLLGPQSPLPEVGIESNRATVRFGLPLARPAGVSYRIDQATTLTGNPGDWSTAARLDPGETAWDTFGGAQVAATPDDDRLVILVTLGGSTLIDPLGFARLVIERAP